METPHSIIYLYSKFSPYCKNFTDLISNIDYITHVCVDNKEVRNKILSSKFTVELVPCILLVYGSGQIEKYEGEQCFQWVQAILQNRQVETVPELIQSPRQDVDEVKQFSPKKDKKIKNKAPPPIEDTESEEDEEESPLPSKPTSNKINDNKVEFTPMDDLLENKEEEPFDLRLLQRGGNDNLPIKKDNAVSNLMAKAQEMQKMRDELDSGSKKPPFPGQK